MSTELDLAYEHCRRIAREQATNFYYAFRTLPKRERNAIYAAYAFCRICDDIADEDLALEEKRRRFAETRRMLAESGSGAADSPVFSALGDARAQFNIPKRYFEEVIEGVEIDLVKSRFDTFDDLREYCYKVASVVGLIGIEVAGYEDPDARGYAVDMGLAMQLTNILRDVREDAERGRIYLPLDEMASFGYTEQELFRGVVNEPFRNLMKLQASRARSYFANSQKLMPLLAPRSRACPSVLHILYSRILDGIERADFDVFAERIGLSRTEKLFLMAKLWALSLLPAARLQRR